ncbi:MAG TPA: aldehyde dehydrogenase family protein [Acidimicrobiales bacterium]|nr:aldehyde dehydrogenase family protein [Acidimicrobiales bacterium]
MAGSWVDSGETLAAENPNTGEVVGSVPAATAEHVEQALVAAAAGAAAMAALTGFERARILQRAAELLDRRCEEMARTISGVAVRFARRAEAGSININSSPLYRADLMPCGGLKHSGFGKEGPRYAVEEMTETKMVVFHGGAAERLPASCPPPARLLLQGSHCWFSPSRRDAGGVAASIWRNPGCRRLHAAAASDGRRHGAAVAPASSPGRGTTTTGP